MDIIWEQATPEGKVVLRVDNGWVKAYYHGPDNVSQVLGMWNLAVTREEDIKHVLVLLTSLSGKQMEKPGWFGSPAGEGGDRE